MGLGYLNHIRTTAEYESTAQLLIDSKTDAPIPVDGTSTRNDRADITTHAAVLQSPTLIDRAIRDYDLGALPIAESPQDLRKMLLDDEVLIISPHEESDAILDVAFQCEDPESSSKVVNGLIAAFQDFYGEMEQNTGEQMLDLVREANSVLAVQLKEKQKSYDAFREKSPLIDREGNALNLHQERMLGIEAERADLELEVNALDVEIKAVEKAFASGMNVTAIRMMFEQMTSKNRNVYRNGMTQGGASNVALHNQLLPKLIEYQSLEDRYGADHPDVLAMRRQLDLLNNMAPAVHNGDSTKIDFEDFTRAELEARLAAKRAIRAAKIRELSALNTMFSEEQADARGLIGYQVRYAELKSDLDRTQKLFDSVVSRLDEVSLTKDHGGYKIQVLAYAEPGRDVSLGIVQQLLRGGVLGTLLGCGLAYLLVLRDVRFTDIKEISRVLELPIMGAIPNFDAELAKGKSHDAAVAPSVQAFHRPKSTIAEGYRGIRTGLYFSMTDRKRVVQVTSPLPGEGKSTLTANLAVSMAASGKRVLVIDADLRRPRQHQLLGENIDSEHGLTSVIEGKSTIANSIFETEVANLSLMPCGRLPENPGELLVSQKMDEMLARVSADYDFVLVDSPPMLAVADPSTIASRVEGVLMTFSLETPRHAVLRSRELLQKVNADIVGVVVNRVDNKKESKLSMYQYGYYNNAYYGYGEFHYDQGHSQELEKPKVLKKQAAEENLQIGV